MTLPNETIMKIVAEYIDHGVSSVAAKRDARKIMLLDAKAKKFSTIYCDLSTDFKILPKYCLKPSRN
jgi:hypothetical protein